MKRAKSVFCSNACPHCGGTILLGYKGKENMAKCTNPKCHKWFPYIRREDNPNGN